MAEEVIPEIVNSVADAKNVEPSKLDTTLYDHIDTSAIEQLVDSNKGTWRFEFDLPEYTVTLWSDGSVQVDPKKQIH